MNIQEATKLALEEGKYITREANSFKAYRILPTNTDDCFVILVAKDYVERLGKNILSKRWNPKAKDIMANDWVVKDL